VEFRSLASSTCIRISRTLPELSITFANKHISFGVVDIGLFQIWLKDLEFLLVRIIVAAHNHNVTDLRHQQRVEKGKSDGLYISCVASAQNLWAVVMDAPIFLHKERARFGLVGDHVHESNVKLNKGDIVKVKGITMAQADVDVIFTFSSLDEVETFDP
ncbi:hypothetical protein Tco_1242143, partial [Tanacetum coccineum]